MIMFRDTILQIYKDISPMMSICLVIIIALRLLHLIKHKKKIVFYKEIIYLGFIIYIMGLFRVVTFQDINFSDFNIIPFKEILRYQFGSKLFYKNVIGNMIMFVPYGFFISYILEEKKFYVPLFLTFLVSITIETTQYRIGRVFDIDDIMLNIIGGIAGYLLYKLALKLKSKLPNLLQKEIVYNIIVLIIILLILLYLMGVFYV